MALMILLCVRGTFGCLAGPFRRGSSEIDELRAGLDELRNEIRKLRARS